MKDDSTSDGNKTIPVKRTSTNLATEQVDRLKEIFPDVVTEGKVDFEKLKAMHGAELPRVSVQAPISALGRFGIAPQMMLPGGGRTLPADRQVGCWLSEG